MKKSHSKYKKDMDPKTYKKYKQRIAEAVAKIDNKPPKFTVDSYYKKRNMIIDRNRVQQLDKDNMHLLRRMNIIVRLGGDVDCWLKKIKRRSNLPLQDVINKMLMKQNESLLQKIRSAGSYYPARELIQSWKEAKMKILQPSQKYQQEPAIQVSGHSSLHDHCMVKDLSLLKKLNPSVRTRCFFEIELQYKGDKQKLGYIQFELYDDIVPRTCANFAELCRGYNGLSYKNTPFHRIVSGYWCQGGDVTKFNGSGGTSIYGESFENENYNLRHAGLGVLSMCSENNTCNSKFNLTFRQLKTVDGKHVVFGKVIAGFSNIYKIEEFGTKTGKPFKRIVISNCGIVGKNLDRINKK